MKNIFLIVIISFFGTIGMGQDTPASVSKKAEKHFENFEYMASTDMYLEAASQGKDLSNDDKYKIAESFRLNSSPEEAIFWYEQIVKENSPGELKINFAKALLSAGNCQLAVKWFKSYIDADDNSQKIGFINNCEELEKFISDDDVLVENRVELNSIYMDCAATSGSSGIVFTSSRVEGNSNKIHKWSKEPFSNIYTATVDKNNVINNIASLTGGINGKYHDGAVAFSPGGKIMYFTRNNSDGKNSKKVIDLKIYTTEFDGENWINVKEFPYNSKDYSTAHPTISSNGKTLFFASDRPGGYGGMDIYISEKIGGMWQFPRNMGDKINSEGNEIFPFVNSNGHLYFSSDGLKGIGGLDIFISKKSDGVWQNSENLGSPYNTRKDDFAYFSSKNESTGYLSSNREGGMGGDDIYSWKLSKRQEQLIKVIVIDSVTDIPIADAIVKMKNEDGQVKNWTSNGSTSEKFQIKKVPSINFECQKEGYDKLVQDVLWETVKTDPLIKLYLKPSLATLSGVVIRELTNQPLERVALTITNECDDELIKMKSDVNGNFEFKAICDCKYNIVADELGYLKEELSFYSDCSSDEKELSVIMKEVMDDKTDVSLNFEEGQVIRLEDVYYDFNKHFIRPDAALELDKLVQLLKKYSSMKIELSSHTDARGSDSYNLNLSQRRAEAAVSYIISKGINSSRLIAKGYGEAQLVNNCKNGVICDDVAHQMNRRTEIKITQFAEKGVRIEE